MGLPLTLARGRKSVDRASYHSSHIVQRAGKGGAGACCSPRHQMQGVRSLSGPISRILSADGFPHPRGDHLSRRTVSRSLQQPTRRLPACEAGPRAPEGTGRAPANGLSFCLALLPMGVAWPCRLPGTPVVSYTTFSPLRPQESPPVVRGMSLWPCPRVAPPGGYPASYPGESGLSSSLELALQERDHPAHSSIQRVSPTHATAEWAYVNGSIEQDDRIWCQNAAMGCAGSVLARGHSRTLRKVPRFRSAKLCDGKRLASAPTLWDSSGGQGQMLLAWADAPGDDLGGSEEACARGAEALNTEATRYVEGGPPLAIASVLVAFSPAGAGGQRAIER